MEIAKVNFVPQEANNQEALKDNQASYNITFSINRAYLLFCMVTLYSLLKNNSKYYFNIYILHNDCLKEEEINKITKQHPLNQYNNFKIHLVDVSHIKELKDLKARGHWTKEIYFKVLLTTLLPQVDKILHLDVDVIVRGDIKELLDMDMDNYLFCGDNYNYQDDADTYICVGVMLMNLTLLREISILNDFIKEYNKHTILVEEEFINQMYKDRIKKTEKFYILNTYNYNRAILKKSINNSNIKILHVSAPKPWILERSNLETKEKRIDEYYYYLKEFIDNKYKLRFKLLTLYAFSVAPIVNSYERRIKTALAKILRKKKPVIKENFLTRKIYKYAIINKK